MIAQVMLFDGFDPLDVIGPFEVLAAGGDAVPGALAVELVAADGPREVVSGTRGLTLRATARLETDRPGYVVLDATGVHAVPARLVDDGDLISAGGVTSSLDLGLYILEREFGPRVAHAVETPFRVRAARRRMAQQRPHAHHDLNGPRCTRSSAPGTSN